MSDAEIVFRVRESPDGGYAARTVRFSIFAQGHDWDELKCVMREAALCHLDDGEAPQSIRVHLFQSEDITV